MHRCSIKQQLIIYLVLHYCVPIFTDVPPHPKCTFSSNLGYGLLVNQWHFNILRILAVSLLLFAFNIGMDGGLTEHVQSSWKTRLYPITFERTLLCLPYITRNVRVYNKNRQIICLFKTIESVFSSFFNNFTFQKQEWTELQLNCHLYVSVFFNYYSTNIIIRWKE